MALTLSRKAGESVVIRSLDGSEITVEVTEVRGSRVRLRIEASLDYQIRRVPSLRVTEGVSDGLGDRVDGVAVADSGCGDSGGVVVGEAACAVDAQPA